MKFQGLHRIRVTVAVTAILLVPEALATTPLEGAEAHEHTASSLPATQQVQADWEGLVSSDIFLTQSSFAYRRGQGRFEFTTRVALNTLDLDYQPAPFDFLGSSTSLSERRISGALSTRTRVFDFATLLVSGGAYHGFSDHRSVWLDAYYRQQFETLPGYQEADPSGVSLSLGLRFELVPGIAYLQADLSHLKDRIAPGYEIDFDGLRRGRPDLHTTSYHVSLENVLHRRVRVLNEARITDTSDRELRYSYQGSLNLALGERWVVRTFVGFAREEPGFRATYAGATVEFEPASGWFVSVAGRYYTDTGEIENSLFSSAAPGLRAWQSGVGVRRVWAGHAIKVFAAPYFTHYEPAGLGTAFFKNLYSSRDWALFQAAYTFDF